MEEPIHDLRAATGRVADVRVHYGYRFPPISAVQATSGLVKVQLLGSRFPDSPERFNVLYLVSSQLPSQALVKAVLARLKGARLVLNQNGVLWELRHEPDRLPTMRALVRLADHVLYQSEFSKACSDSYLVPRSGSWEILYNAVDTERFTPATQGWVAGQPLLLLLAGTHWEGQRVDLAMQVLASLVRRQVDAILHVAGRLNWTGDDYGSLAEARQRAHGLGVLDRVMFLGPFTQQEAPDIYQKANVLLHTQVDDACPPVVLEAMAAGLPVVHLRSGGVPELVGEAEGIGVPLEGIASVDLPRASEQMADAVLRVAGDWDRFSRAARQHAVERHALGPWLARHRQVFEAVTKARAD